MPDVIEVLADLVSIPSVNPMGEPAVGDEFGEARIADYVTEFLTQHGIRSERQLVQPGRENVLAKVEGGRSDVSILLETHMDTVRVDHMEIAPFDPVQADGRLHGRGSCDAKGSLAAMLVTLAELQAGGAPVDVWLCAAADEEYSFGGASALVDSGFTADYAIVGEPTKLDVVTAHKGAARWRVTAKGRPAHSATPWEGDNAIYRMARIVGALEQWAKDLQEEPPHPRLGPRTLSVGTISGGQTVNSVPDRCAISIDRRVLPDEDLPDVVDSMQRFLDERGLMASVSVEPLIVDSPMEVDDDSPWAQAVLSAAREVCDASTAAVHYGTDASNFAAAGIASVVIGPGDISQ
ncbi:MAG TPA: M20/M25/M40 family metallo-hydrolase, partial [Armatimonadota bacterium]|nr:M20/M25/M40 family metallo-hydrolase [Armatimonadota bacterium]